jgi:hypothetical protein
MRVISVSIPLSLTYIPISSAHMYKVVSTNFFITHAFELKYSRKTKSVVSKRLMKEFVLMELTLRLTSLTFARITKRCSSLVRPFT